jgi:hypothetical protein
MAFVVAAQDMQVPTGFTMVPVMMVPAQVAVTGQWGCAMTPGTMTPCGMMTPSGIMTPSGMMTPSGAMTPTCHKRNDQRHSAASTAVPSETQSYLHSEDNSDDEDDGDCNEACAELISQLEAGGEAKAAAIEALIGSVAELSFDAAACRVVQKALECCDTHEAVEMALELKSRVRDAIRCPHANHVVQKIVELLPVDDIIFILDELVGAIAEFSRHRYGCRVLVKLLDRFRCRSELKTAIITEVEADSGDLVRHTWGHYVIEAILQFGDAEQKSCVCSTLCQDLPRNAKNRCATYVVEKALCNCGDDDLKHMLDILAGTPESLASLVDNQFGCHVAKALVKLPAAHAAHAMRHLEAATPALQKSKYGRRLLEEHRKSVQ